MQWIDIRSLRPMRNMNQGIWSSLVQASTYLQVHVWYQTITCTSADLSSVEPKTQYSEILLGSDCDFILISFEILSKGQWLILFVSKYWCFLMSSARTCHVDSLVEMTCTTVLVACHPHWSGDKMADIFQMTLSNAFSWIKIVFWWKFHWNLFPRVQLAIFHH